MEYVKNNTDLQARVEEHLLNRLCTALFAMFFDWGSCSMALKDLEHIRSLNAAKAKLHSRAAPDRCVYDSDGRYL